MRRRFVSRAIPSWARINALQFRGKRLRASTASFLLSGSAAVLRLAAGTFLAAGPGAFLVSGQSASLMVSRVLAAAAGAFALSGQTASFVLGKGLTADAAAFALSGQTAALFQLRNLAAAPVAFALGGQTAGLLQTKLLAAAPTSYALTGQDAGLVAGKTLAAAAATLALSGQAAGLLQTRLLSAAPASLALSGQDAGLVLGKTLGAGAVAFALSGQDAGLLVGRRVAGDAGSFALTGQAATLTKSSSASLAFVTSVNADAATITMPTVLDGDFVVFADMPARANSGSTQPAVVTPTATGITFTPLVQFPVTGDDGGATRNVIQWWGWAFIAAAADSGKVVTGSNTGATAGFRRKIIAVFRRTPVATGFNAFESASKVWSTGDPAATSSALSAGTAPFIGIAGYRAEAAFVSPTMSPTADGDILAGTATQLSYKIFNAADAGTLAADQGDAGSSQLTVSFLVEVT